MLVLSRKKGESIVIGDNIELTVLSVEGDTIKLGIKAPKEIDIMRKEILVSVQENNQDAVVDPKLIMQMVKKSAQ
ncbi:carbon storage regulator [Saccharibacillus sp. O23]|uniref:carbon storage regulator CsrA n=1 Tax=Saccharibacillus sp. O23 TaxID=2009338 RepID=UPI000B4E7E45|nr:carbon storage regulator CsrA [Saccharibacillus sp. O23]OWR26861.1 carbon storage regulator [Saccharibacillus sp. O23]